MALILSRPDVMTVLTMRDAIDAIETALAMQDVATAKLVYERARAMGLGTEVEL